MKNLKLLVLLNKEILISEIEEVGSELGEPDCKLTNPYVVLDDESISPWLSNYSDQNIFMIHSDKILTISEPNSKIIHKYNELMK